MVAWVALSIVASTKAKDSDRARKLPLVRAAGGVVLRAGKSGPEVLVVHRPRYDDWSLPKGKLDQGEKYRAAALREVEEETGYCCELGEELEAARYVDGSGRPKKVRWFLMAPLKGEFKANDEVDRIKWLSLESAEHKLDYSHDQVLIRGLRYRYTRAAAA